jgi:hypothetical protein
MPKNAEYIPTPQEQAALDYHRRHLAGRTYLQNPDGSLTTFYGAIVGPDDGMYRLIPTYWGGARREVPEAMEFAMRSGIDFPSYKSLGRAEAAERALHDIMTEDTRKYQERKAAARK